MVRQQQAIEIWQIVRPRNRCSALLKDCFQIFFGRLLAVEADLVMKLPSCAEKALGRLKVVFGLSQPCPGDLFHRGLFLG